MEQENIDMLRASDLNRFSNKGLDSELIIVKEATGEEEDGSTDGAELMDHTD